MHVDMYVHTCMYACPILPINNLFVTGSGPHTPSAVAWSQLQSKDRQIGVVCCKMETTAGRRRWWGWTAMEDPRVRISHDGKEHISWYCRSVQVDVTCWYNYFKFEGTGDLQGTQWVKRMPKSIGVEYTVYMQNMNMWLYTFSTWSQHSHNIYKSSRIITGTFNQPGSYIYSMHGTASLNALLIDCCICCAV